MASDNVLLERVRKLLAKAESAGVTGPEAEALTAKAAELMARYGIDRALLAAARPETDQPANRVITVPNPWARVQAHLLCGLASAMRCQCIILPSSAPGTRIGLLKLATAGREGGFCWEAPAPSRPGGDPSAARCLGTFPLPPHSWNTIF